MEPRMKQVIVVRKDLDMSYGKFAAQVSHASMAFLTNAIRTAPKTKVSDDTFAVDLLLDADTYQNWIDGIFTKVILRAKNRSDLEKLVNRATANGLMANTDFFCIHDNCLTELEPEEDGTCFTCVGFRPMWPEEIDAITKRYQLYR